MARRIQAIATSWGLNLDVPLEVYNALFNMRNFFDLTADDRAALSSAVESREGAEILRLTGISGKNAERTISWLRSDFVRMLAGAHVPATGATPRDLKRIAPPLIGKITGINARK